MEFFYVVKATQKSGKEDAVIWFTAKSEARANLQLDVELEDAGIETGRGKDYAKPVRTDFPVYNDLPEESTVDYTWCKRYELQDDGRTWLPKAGAESTGAGDNTPAPETTVNVETTIESVPLENRTPAVRFAVHLTSDKYQSHITKEQQLAASEMSLDEGNTYLQNLLLAKNGIPEVAELSLNAEWKLVQAIKQVFAPDETHEAEVIAAFMADWTRADAGNRNQLVEEWRSGKLNLLKSEITSVTGVTTEQDPEPDNGIQIDVNDDETTRYPVVRMPFRKQLLAQFTSDELRHHLTREEYEGISALEMDTDNSYVQNLLLAAENCEEVKGYDTKDLWRYTDAIRKVFSQDTRNSTLWADDPRQQLAYLAVKRWARLFCPDVILGVYTPDELDDRREEREVNPVPAQHVSLADISGDNVTTTQTAQESAQNIDALADDFRDRIEAAQDVDSAKALRADIETVKATLGSALFTELKNKAVKRYYLVDARNKVEAAINSLPPSDDPDAAARFAEVERVLASSKRHLGDELHGQFSITLADMKPEYVD